MLLSGILYGGMRVPKRSPFPRINLPLKFRGNDEKRTRPMMFLRSPYWRIKLRRTCQPKKKMPRISIDKLTKGLFC